MGQGLFRGIKPRRKLIFPSAAWGNGFPAVGPQTSKRDRVTALPKRQPFNRSTPNFKSTPRDTLHLQKKTSACRCLPPRSCLPQRQSQGYARYGHLLIIDTQATHALGPLIALDFFSRLLFLQRLEHTPSVRHILSPAFVPFPHLLRRRHPPSNGHRDEIPDRRARV